VILSNRDVFRGHEMARELARMLNEELPEHRSFEYTDISIEGKMAFLEWSYEDDSVRVRRPLLLPLENRKIVTHSIYYTIEEKPQ